MEKVRMYTTATCPYCIRAKALFTQKQIPVEEIRVDTDPVQRAEMERLSGRRTVPQIFIGDHPIGGCDDLMALHKSGELDRLLHG